MNRRQPTGWVKTPKTDMATRSFFKLRHGDMGLSDIGCLPKKRLPCDISFS